jgi:hypothetical protein
VLQICFNVPVANVVLVNAAHFGAANEHADWETAPMRWLIVSAAVLSFWGPAVAREPLARPMERTPSIMVGGEMAKPARTLQKKATKARARRTGRAPASRVARPIIVPRLSAIYETEVRSINRGIMLQQQQLQYEQRQQIELNLLRQEILRSRAFPLLIPPFGCSPRCWGR